MIVEQAKQVPVQISYTYGGKRYIKEPDEYDLQLIKKINDFKIPYPFPTNQLPKGDKTSDPMSVGVDHVHQFYTK